MPYLIGSLIGALMGVYLLYKLLHWAIFKRITPDRVLSNVLAAVAAYPVGSALYDLGNAASSLSEGFILYLFPSLIVIALAVKRGRTKVSERKLSAVFE